jgi:hypothetical protein
MKLSPADIKRLPKHLRDQVTNTSSVVQQPKFSTWPTTDPANLLYQMLVKEYGCAVHAQGNIVRELVLAPHEKRYRFDIAHLPTKTLFELNGWQYHHQLESFRRDHDKQRYALKKGYLVVNVMAKDVLNSPQTLLADIAQILSYRQHSPTAIKSYGQYYQVAATDTC